MQLENPFHTLLPETLGIQEIKSQAVDRAEPLSTVVNALIFNHQNVLIYGQRGIGKTFLIRLIQEKLTHDHRDTFPIVVNLAGLPAYAPNDSASAFPRAVLLQLCSEVWKQLLKKEYSSLRDRLSESGAEITLRTKPERTVQKIYSNLMITGQKLRFEWQNSLGFSAGAKGESKEVQSIEKQQSDVLPFEFLEFVDELKSHALAKYGKTRIIALCDEANRLSIFNQHEILERYIQLFSSKNLQFIFVAGHHSWESIGDLPSSFETIIELKGFPTVNFTREMINKRLSGVSGIRFTDDAITILHSAFAGHPLFIIEAAAKCFQGALKRINGEVNTADAELASKELKATLRLSEKQVKQEKSRHK